MKRQRVESSNIRSVGHDPETNKLHVQFKDGDGSAGKIAEYDNVPGEKHAAFLGADSKGAFFHKHIRGNAEHPWRYV